MLIARIRICRIYTNIILNVGRLPTHFSVKSNKLLILEKSLIFSRSKRHYDVKKAEYDAEVNTAKAEADLAYDLKVVD